MAESKTTKTRAPAGALAAFLFSVAFLSISFYTNVFRIASTDLFNREITESFVIGRLAKSSQDGIFSAAGLLGHGGPDTSLPDYVTAMDLQYEVYLQEMVLQSYETYDSQIGGQAMILAGLDRLIPGSPAARLEIHRAVASVLAAAALSLIVVWFYLELGAIAGLFAFASLGLSSWLLAFAHNLFWSLWSFYLPMIAVMYHLRRRGGVRWDPTLVFLIFGTVLLKCFLNGYEFITTTLIMMTVPLVYYRLRDRGSPHLVADLTKAAAVSITAVVLSFVVLIGQIAAQEGSIASGVGHIVDSLRRRSYSDPSAFPEVADDLRASVWEVLQTYVMGPFLDLSTYVYSENPFIVRWVLEVRYVYLIVLFAIATAILARPRDADPRVRALTLTTWFSALAPLSWFVLFKAHSFEHPHMNFIVWQMPFTIFGFALCGLAVKHLLAARFANRTVGSAVSPAR